MLTVEELARLLDLHVVVVRNKLRSGDFPGVKVFSNRWRIPRHWAESVLRCETPAQPNCTDATAGALAELEFLRQLADAGPLSPRSKGALQTLLDRLSSNSSITDSMTNWCVDSVAVGKHINLLLLTSVPAVPAPRNYQDLWIRCFRRPPFWLIRSVRTGDVGGTGQTADMQAIDSCTSSGVDREGKRRAFGPRIMPTSAARPPPPPGQTPARSA